MMMMMMMMITIFGKVSLPDFTKTYPVGAESFPTNRWTDMMKLTVAFPDFVNASKKNI